MSLTVQQMARLDHLLDQAQDLDADGRRRWLEGLPDVERDLLPILQRALLSAGLDRTTGLPPLGRAAAELRFECGQRVGPYVLVQLLGKGGMAQVWLARRADGAYEREVALKLPATQSRRAELELRFARERNILAALEHANIARFYDAGSTQDGISYLALEYVPGRNITTWCDARTCGLRERIVLFLQVLDAVQYAHARGVLHRDLKPSNILVTESGDARLIDFGVARQIERAPRTDLTADYGRALTPGYASPEQLSGAALGPASDIYSLGVVLHELLCGSAPSPPTDGPGYSTQRAGATPPTQRPSELVSEEAAQSRGASAARLARSLNGDLDAIVVKALCAEAPRRYPSVAALAGDLKRYLAGEPVAARPAGPLQRGAKFVARHPAGVAAGAALAVLMLALAATTLRGRAPAAPLAGDDKSIAVLPFVNMSADPDQEYFADGLSEELIDRLARSPDLRVIARTSSFAFKGKNEDARSIAATLGVANLLEGSVRKNGEELRITAQLVRAADGTHVWSQTYVRDLSDIFKVQEEIAGTVASALKSALAAGRAMNPPSKNLAAYNLLLEGNFFLARSNKEDSLRAIEFYRQAIASDPDCATAWAALGGAYAYQAAVGWTGVAEGRENARAALQTALRLDPELSVAHERLGFIAQSFDWDWSAARAHFQRALELDPANYHAAESLAWLTSGIYGRLDEVIDIYRAGVAREPLDAHATISLASAIFNAGHYDEAVTAARRVVLLNPSFASAYAFEALPLVYLGRLDEALAAAQNEADETWRLSSLPIVYFAMGRKAESDVLLHKLETRFGDRAAYNIADVYAFRGEPDLAFQWLARAYRQRDAGMTYVRVDPLLATLRQDPRYRMVLAQMNLDRESPETDG